MKYIIWGKYGNQIFEFVGSYFVTKNWFGNLWANLNIIAIFIGNLNTKRHRQFRMGIGNGEVVLGIFGQACSE